MSGNVFFAGLSLQKRPRPLALAENFPVGERSRFSSPLQRVINKSDRYLGLAEKVFPGGRVWGVGCRV
ncbi:hypothetical protein [Microcystis aeruginosa]|uniref:Uncharacterized protein n=1 Tax=Microcystis aeruginosa (strain NIES-843 / IAM M-2473) TaxID=449447 RepID=B0JM27_MICAN|nr:hypothetical protein [Microcystis aeruginosa]BAG00044.1 unknown protein [Microcystis aeruginosa NIES-843]